MAHVLDAAGEDDVARPERDLTGMQLFPPVLDPTLRWIVCVAPSGVPPCVVMVASCAD